MPTARSKGGCNSVGSVDPKTAVNLLALGERAGRRLEIPVILASSEVLSASVHRSLDEDFRCRVLDYSGQAEPVCLAWSSRPEELSFDACDGRVELDAPEPCDGSVGVVRFIATNSWNAAMPLIRYDTGDAVSVPRPYGAVELAEIAAGTRPFLGIAGRDNDLSRPRCRGGSP